MTFVARCLHPFSLCVAALLVANVSVAGDVHINAANVLGTDAANCKQCHPSETAHWKRTSHFKSLDRLAYTGNGKKYADALQIAAGELATTSLCADCHSTKKEVEGVATAVSGVSCESCHGGSKDWLVPHGEYTDGATFTTLAALRNARATETDDHRTARLESTKAAGMIRPDMLHELATNCLSCHIVDNEKLVAAGHKAASNFELTSWLNGEVRHNFFVNPEVNANAPSLLAETTGVSAAERNRVKFVVGELAKTEMVLRSRANATNPAVIPQLGGIVAAANGKYAQINAIAGTPETQAVAGKLAPLLGLIFAPLPTDSTTYTGIADDVESQTKAFIENHDGTSLGGLDGLINALPPHYSQQFVK